VGSAGRILPQFHRSNVLRGIVVAPSVSTVFCPARVVAHDSYSGTVSLEGGYDPTLDGVLSALVLAATPATSTFSYHPSGGSGRAIAGSAYVASYRVDTPGDDTATWRSELAVAGTITDS
jgi:hypothetical protein